MCSGTRCKITMIFHMCVHLIVLAHLCWQASQSQKRRKQCFAGEHFIFIVVFFCTFSLFLPHWISQFPSHCVLLLAAAYSHHWPGEDVNNISLLVHMLPCAQLHVLERSFTNNMHGGVIIQAHSTQGAQPTPSEASDTFHGMQAHLFSTAVQILTHI